MKIRRALHYAIFGPDVRESIVGGSGDHVRMKPKVIELSGRRFLVTELAGPSAAERKRAAAKGQAMSGGRFPIRNHDDLKKAIHAVGRAKPGSEHNKVRRFVIKRAKAIGGSHLIPSHWSADGSLKS